MVHVSLIMAVEALKIEVAKYHGVLSSKFGGSKPNEFHLKIDVKPFKVRGFMAFLLPLILVSGFAILNCKVPVGWLGRGGTQKCYPSAC